MKFYIYILRSLKDGSYYVGYTSDLAQRVWEHNEGSTGYTSAKRPWELVYQEEFEDKGLAIKRELFIKAQKKEQEVHRTAHLRRIHPKLNAALSSRSLACA
jgi:putative endonuclease